MSRSVVLTCALIAMIPAVRAADPQSCPVTRPPDPAFAPLYLPHPLRTGFYVGSAEFFARLPDGDLRGLSTTAGIRVKFPWFAQDLGREEIRHAELTVSGRPLDGSTARLTVEGPNVAWTTHYFYSSILVFPVPGCWDITARREQSELKFVVWVASF